jgi:transposase
VNKKTGVTYVYESESYWDKDKKQPRNKRVCIGKIDPSTNEFIPSKRLVRTHSNNYSEVDLSDQRSKTSKAQVSSMEIVGPSMILDNITKEFGIDEILQKCFPGHAKQIMTIAYYLAIDGRALSHCFTWCKSHAPKMADSLTSQNISRILAEMSFDSKQRFLKIWMKKIIGSGYFCYDITSISSYSESNEYIKYGYNRDKESLPQLNLAVLFSQDSKLPAYFHRMPGNITDVSTIHNLLKTFKLMDMPRISYVLDKGFYSKKNIDEIIKAREKFLVSVPLSNKWLHEAIDDIYDSIHGPIGYKQIDDEILYVHTRPYVWKIDAKNHRLYLHIYYNAKAKAESIDKFNQELILYKEELESDQLVKKNEWAYETFFIIKNTPKRGRKIKFNMNEISKYVKRYTGFYCLLTNDIKDPVESLKIYRDKDVVEKCFDDYKNQLDMKRLRMHSSSTVDSRLFIQFIALIYLSAIRQKLRIADMTKQYTARELLGEMETIAKITYHGKQNYALTEITKPQKRILEKLEISGCLAT